MPAKLRGATDVVGFRTEALQLLAQQVPPGDVQWELLPEVDPYCDPSPRAVTRPRNLPRAATAIVPTSFMRVCELVVLHRDPERFSLLYRLLWRLVHEPDLRGNPLDGDMVRAQQMAHAVRREVHKMKADLRFRVLLRPDGSELHLACHAPLHHVVEVVAPWLAKRMTARSWAVFTPDRSVRCTDGRLLLGPAVPAGALPAADASDGAWLHLLEEVFGPHRPGSPEPQA